MPVIIHLITDLETGGAETALVKLLAEHRHAPYTPVVVSMTGRGALGNAVEAEGATLHSLGMRRGHIDPGGLFRLIGLLRRYRPEILQSWMYHADLLGLIAGRLARVPRILWNVRCSNMDMSAYSRMSLLVVRILARLSRQPEAVVVNSLAGRAWHQHLGYRPRRWEYIPNGFDTARFRPDAEARVAIRGELGIPSGAPLIGMLARVDPSKNHGCFLAAAARLSEQRPEAHFLLAGTEIEAGNPALAGVAALGSRIHLLGERRDVPRVIAAFDIATLTSAFGEGFPNFIGEAMACAVPCVVTDVGDSRRIVGDGGLVVPPSDAAALAEAWARLIAIGPEARAEIGAAARARIKKEFTAEATARQYQALYAGERGSGPAAI